MSVNLADFPVGPAIAVSDMERARGFYEGKLGLTRRRIGRRRPRLPVRRGHGHPRVPVARLQRPDRRDAARLGASTTSQRPWTS